MKFSGKNVLITGASRGIGAATAIAFGRQGANVTVNYSNNKEAAELVVSTIKESGGNAFSFKADAFVQQEVQNMFAESERRFGSVDILILNAGAEVKFQSFLELKWEDLERKVLGELKANYWSIVAAIPGMQAKKKGTIISVSSALSRTPGYGFAAHSIAKAALDALVKSLAYELGPMGIRVNAVAPGLTYTDATSWLPPENFEKSAKKNPLRRISQPGDIAGAILTIASDDAGFINGAYIPADGGLTML